MWDLMHFGSIFFVQAYVRNAEEEYAWSIMIQRAKKELKNFEGK